MTMTNPKKMEKLKQILTSKKFWTLVTAIVAALAAFFTVSCSGYKFVRSNGLHIDTVYQESYIKFREMTP